MEQFIKRLILVSQSLITLFNSSLKTNTVLMVTVFRKYFLVFALDLDTPVVITMRKCQANIKYRHMVTLEQIKLS